jgi:hypothetical protein
MTLINHVALLLFGCLRILILVSAYPGGAGGCTNFGAAVGAPHRDKPVTIHGTLEQGFVTVTLEPIETSAANTTQSSQEKIMHLSPGGVILLDLDQEYRLCVNRVDSGFKGVLIRWGGGTRGTDTVDIFESYDKSQVLESFYCYDAKVGGLTHRNNDIKYQVCADIAPFSEVAISMPLDVTVVVRNAIGVSEFHYSRFYLNAGAGAIRGWFSRWWCGLTSLCFS